MSALTPPPYRPAARIMDRGYRRYSGVRGGIGHAMSSVTKYTVQRVLGIHRKFRFKVMPILIIAISYVPHLVYVGVVVLTNQLANRQQELDAASALPAGAPRAVASQLIQDYPGTYTNIVAAIALFAAFVGPEVLCTDRRTGMLGLYMASPLNRWSYLSAKASAVAMVLLTVTLGPSVLLLIGYSTQAYGPSGLVDWVTTILRVVAVGLGLAAFHTMLSMAISSITTRRAAASAAFIVLVMGTGVLIPVVESQADAPATLGMFNLLALPLEFAYRVFGQVSPIGVERASADIAIDGSQRVIMPTWSVYAAFAGWIVVSALVIWDRYRRIEVTK